MQSPSTHNESSPRRQDVKSSSDGHGDTDHHHDDDHAEQSTAKSISEEISSMVASNPLLTVAAVAAAAGLLAVVLKPRREPSLYDQASARVHREANRLERQLKDIAREAKTADLSNAVASTSAWLSSIDPKILNDLGPRVTSAFEQIKKKMTA